MNNQSGNEFPLWEVFIQGKPGQPHKHAGSVHAPDKTIAMQNARDVYSRRGEVYSIWVVPANAITASPPDDAESFSANDKPYRHPTFYNIPAEVKNI